MIRGKFGLTQSVSIWDVVAGDVILLSSGSKVPADCLVINSFDLQVEDGDADDDQLEDEQRKEQKGSIEEGGDPFLRAGSIIEKGSCKAVVCCVGVHSTRGIIEPKLNT